MKQRKPQGNKEYPFRDTYAVSYGIAAAIKAYMRKHGITIKQLAQHVTRFSYASLDERLGLSFFYALFGRPLRWKPE